ncbi:MAG: ATP-binding cassette domain-containing protein [Verrucomicrobiota bacterium]
MSLLRVEHLSTTFTSGGFPSLDPPQVFRAVDDVSFQITEGSVSGIVGESGCGKTTLALTLLKIIPLSFGKIYFKERPIHKTPEYRFRPHRGDIQMISANPDDAFRPGWNVKRLFFEVLYLHHRELPRREKRDRMRYLLESVGLEEDILPRHPSSLSFFDRQRVCLARILAAQPRLLICDDPTRDLDTVSQARILDILKDIQVHWRVTLLYLSRDYAAVAHMSDQMHVMNRGRFVESGTPDDLFHQATHEYTRLLLAHASAP